MSKPRKKKKKHGDGRGEGGSTSASQAKCTNSHHAKNGQGERGDALNPASHMDEKQCQWDKDDQESRDRIECAGHVVEVGGGKDVEVVKTEAEVRFEENRRKRLEERLRREGRKTHKQRVEELNRYLSRLSEHHDMPRIGPG